MLTQAKSGINVEKLWETYCKDNDIKARDQLIIHYGALVKHIAHRLAISLPPNVQTDDLISYGTFGLIEAIQRFDPSKGFKFETFAMVRIRGSMIDGLRAMDWVPYSVRQKSKTLEKAYNDLEMELGRTPSDEELANKLGINQNELEQMLRSFQLNTLVSIDDHVGDKGESETTRLIDLIRDDKAEDPLEQAEIKELKAILVEALGKLPERERLVIALYYYEGLTLKEIGKVLEVSESRICQMHGKAILRLRGRLSRSKKKIF